MMAFSLFTGRLEVLWLLLGEMAYVYYVVLRLRRGLPRLVAILPVLPPVFIIPWRGQTGPERSLYSFLFHWTIMSKLLLVVWDAGPAADPHAISSFPRFFSAMTFSLHLNRDRRFISRHNLKAASAAALESSISDAADDDREASRIKNGAHPEVSNGLGRRKAKSGALVKEKKNGESNKVSTEEEPLLELQSRAGKKEKVQSSFLRWIEMMVNSQAGRIVLLRSVFYFIVDVCLIRAVLQLRHVLPSYVLNLLLAFTIYFSCLVLFESPAGACACLFGTKLHPQFNMPFLADSLADFWGRRWNLMINNLLRVSVYEPVIAFLIQRKEQKEKQRMKIKPSPLDRSIATAAAFTVSGLEHELIFFYLNKTRPTGEMTAFFLVNGAATIVEGLVKPRQRLGMPRLLGWAYTMTFVYVTGCWLFFPPVLRTGMVDQCLTDLRKFTDWILGM